MQDEPDEQTDIHELEHFLELEFVQGYLLGGVIDCIFDCTGVPRIHLDCVVFVIGTFRRRGLVLGKKKTHFGVESQNNLKLNRSKSSQVQFCSTNISPFVRHEHFKTFGTFQTSSKFSKTSDTCN